ncbi:MAG: RDD family protein [bacterium]
MNKHVLLDTNYTVDTPEGVRLSLHPVGVSARFWAWSLDVTIRMGVNLFLLIVLSSFLDNFGLGLWFIIVFLLEWFYPVYFELRHRGQTPGKKVLHIYVAQVDGSPVSPAASLIRNLIRFIDFLPFFYAFGLISVLLTRRFQRLGDLAASTVVLYLDDSQNKSKHHLTDDHQPLSHPIRPPYAFNLVEQQTIIRFAQRRHSLSNDRANELALKAGSWVNECRAQYSPADYLCGIAAWLEGKHNQAT